MLVQITAQSVGNIVSKIKLIGNNVKAKTLSDRNELKEVSLTITPQGKLYISNAWNDQCWQIISTETGIKLKEEILD